VSQTVRLSKTKVRSNAIYAFKVHQTIYMLLVCWYISQLLVYETEEWLVKCKSTAIPSVVISYASGFRHSNEVTALPSFDECFNHNKRN